MNETKNNLVPPTGCHCASGGVAFEGGGGGSLSSGMAAA